MARPFGITLIRVSSPHHVERIQSPAVGFQPDAKNDLFRQARRPNLLLENLVRKAGSITA